MLDDKQVCVVPKSAGFSIPDSKPWALPGDKCRPVWVGGLLNYYLIPASSHICHGARPHPKPNEPSLGVGAHLRLGLALTPILTPTCTNRNCFKFLFFVHPRDSKK